MKKCFVHYHSYLGGGNSNLFYVHPEPWGNSWSNLTINMFQMGGSKNHQLDIFQHLPVRVWTLRDITNWTPYVQHWSIQQILCKKTLQQLLRLESRRAEVGKAGKTQGAPAWSGKVLVGGWNPTGFGKRGIFAIENKWMFPKIVGFPTKSSILIGFSIFFHPFWGNPIFGNTHMLWMEFFENHDKLN